MGFSVSGSAVVVLLGLFVAMSAFYTSGANTMERLSAAEREQAERVDRAADTDFDIRSVELLTGVACGVDVRANNTGTTTLSLAETTLLFENSVRTDWRTDAEVDGDASTDVWAPGQQLRVTLDGLVEAPDSVAFVSKTGVTRRQSTEGLLC